MLFQLPRSGLFTSPLPLLSMFMGHMSFFDVLFNGSRFYPQPPQLSVHGLWIDISINWFMGKVCMCCSYGLLCCHFVCKISDAIISEYKFGDYWSNQSDWDVLNRVQF